MSTLDKCHLSIKQEIVKHRGKVYIAESVYNPQKYYYYEIKLQFSGTSERFVQNLKEITTNISLRNNQPYKNIKKLKLSNYFYSIHEDIKTSK